MGYNLNVPTAKSIQMRIAEMYEVVKITFYYQHALEPFKNKGLPKYIGIVLH